MELGPVVGFEAGWLMWLARVSSFAANGNPLVGYAALFWPAIATGAGRNIFLSLVTLSLVAINILGVRNALRANNLFTAGKLIPMALFIGAGLWFADWGRFTPDSGGQGHGHCSLPRSNNFRSIEIQMKKKAAPKLGDRVAGEAVGHTMIGCGKAKKGCGQ